nr:uncharacterized protein LOC109403083 [Aedes albopictus]XP_029724695.1 uncharacterized protein LOC109403083 [Aedes albopictus]
MSAKEEQQNEAAVASENGETTEEVENGGANGTETQVEPTEDKPTEVEPAEEKPVEAPKEDETTEDKPADPPKDEEPSAVAGEEAVVEEEAEEFESPPEDLDDFVVLDEVDMSDGEDEEEDADGEEGEKSKDMYDFDGKQWDCPVHRMAPRTYTKSELQPTDIDPRCKADFPLAKYWPVYLGNFYVPRAKSDYNVFFTAHKYFASKGLPSFMIFRLKDTFFEEYQMRVGLFDMLVYFINKKDANRAINACHGDTFYGHKLKVYDGRTAMKALAAGRNSKLFKVKHLVAEDKLETETVLEDYLRQYGQVVFLSKQSLDHFVVQLNHQPNRKGSIMQDPRLKATPVKGPIKKQRFIEGDVMDELNKQITDNPKFMRTRLHFLYLKFISHGVIPKMRMPWLYNKSNKDATRGVPSSAQASAPRSARHYTREVVPQKRRYDHNVPYGNGSHRQESKQQLLNEARQLEEQLRAVQSKINAKIQVQNKPLPPPAKKPALNPEVTKTRRQKTEAQIMRQRIRGARRWRGPRFD